MKENEFEQEGRELGDAIVDLINEKEKMLRKKHGNSRKTQNMIYNTILSCLANVVLSSIHSICVEPLETVLTFSQALLAGARLAKRKKEECTHHTH